MKNVDLKVPYAQKDAAKALGAWWSSERKCWFVPSGLLLAPFAEWLPAGAWLAENERTGKVRKLSMTESAIRTRDKKAAAKASRRADDANGKVIIGAGYVPTEGAGPPWN